MNTFEKKSQNSKEKFIQSAIFLINEKGYNGITVQDICTQSGMSVGAFYHHFSTKEDVIIAAYRNFDNSLQENYHIEDFGNWKDAVCYLLNAYLEYSKNNGLEFAKATIRAQLSIEDSYITDQSRFFYSSLTQALSLGIYQGGIHPDFAAEQLCNWLIRTVRGSIFEWALRKGESSLLEIGKNDYEAVLYRICFPK